MDATPFGQLVRRLRRARDLTLADVAAYLGFSVAYISEIERDRRSVPRDEVVTRIAACLGADEAELLAAAAVTRGAFVLPVEQGWGDRQATGAMLARAWPSLTLDELGRIAEVCRRAAA